MREQLSDLLNRTNYLHEPTLIIRQGKAVVVLVSVDDWEQYLQMKAAVQKREAEAATQTAQSVQEGVESENGRE